MYIINIHMYNIYIFTCTYKYEYIYIYIHICVCVCLYIHRMKTHKNQNTLTILWMEELLQNIGWFFHPQIMGSKQSYSHLSDLSIAGFLSISPVSKTV